MVGLTLGGICQMGKGKDWAAGLGLVRRGGRPECAQRL